MKITPASRWHTAPSARNGNRCGGGQKMSVKRTLNRGLNALAAVAKNLLTAISIGNAHQRPERGAGRSTTPKGYGRWGRSQSPPEGGCNGSSDIENNARARGRTPGTRQSWLRRIIAGSPMIYACLNLPRNRHVTLSVTQFG